MEKKVSLIIFALVLLLSSCRQPAVSKTASEPAENVPTKTSNLDERIRRVENGLIPINEDGQVEWEKPKGLVERMERYQVPGVSIAVINDYEIEWAKGYGVLEAGGDEPVTPETLFHAGSVAKPVSTAATLTLVEKGLLDLDEDINNKLTSWKVPENEFTVEEKVTLRRLLSHSAGLEDGFTNRGINDPTPDYVAPAGEAPTLAIQQLLDAPPGVDVDGATSITMIPGTKYRYANADYAIVELLVVDVTKKPFDEFMQETILGPLGMNSSTYEQPLPEELRARATTEHSSNGQPFNGKRGHFPLLAAGGLWTTPSDLGRFAIEIMLAYKGQSEEVISREMATEMLTPQIDTPDDLLGDSFGLGFHLAGEGQNLAFQHTGATWGSTSLLWAYPETGQGVIIMTNSSSNQGIIRLEILLSLASEYGWSDLLPDS